MRKNRNSRFFIGHLDDTEEGRDVMCESFTKLADKVADERAEQTTINNIKLMMNEGDVDNDRIENECIPIMDAAECIKVLLENER